MNFLEIVLLFGIAIAGTNAQFPAECSCPDSCICSLEDQTIDCVSQSLEHIPVELNSCSWPGITKVDLSGNSIRFVHEFTFSLLGNITHLFLYDNLIVDIDRSAFIGLHSLEFLFLDGNRLVSIPYTAFWPLRHLKRLLLYGNLLTDLPIGIFQSQQLLTQLALYNNRLRTLRTEVFDDLPLLQELYLHDNDISDLSNAPFRSLRQLNTLYLSENRLTRLTRFDFLGLNKLSLLLLSNNQVSSIEDDTFKTTLKLQFLYLENNELSNVNLLVFAGAVELLQLRLFNNQIERISNGAFFRLGRLQKLHLYGNELTEINPQTFVGLDSLVELTLYSNRIRSIPNDTFLRSPRLEQLWLYNNELSCIEVAAFRGLGNLQLLQLGQNRLSYLPEAIFTFTPSLKYLLLYANNFRAIGNRPFRNLTNLVQLSLISNSIEYMAEGAIDGSDRIFYFQWSTLRDPNSLMCDCSALWLYQWMVSRDLQSSVICTGPSEFEGQDIRSLTTASFGCSATDLRVTVPSVERVVARNGCLRLECSSVPRGPVQWERVDGQLLRPTSESCLSVPPCGDGAQGGAGVLMMEGMRGEDGGHYMCTAAFQNSTAAQVCHVVIGDPPTLLEEPEELVLPHPGSIAIFHLRFTGNPWPEVAWFHTSLSGEVTTPLTEEGPEPRYYITKNGSLVIPITRLADEGVYRAMIRNGAGEVSTEIPLSFMFETSCHTTCLHGGTCVDISVCLCSDLYQGASCESESERTVDPSEDTPTVSSVTYFTPNNPTDTTDHDSYSGDTESPTDSYSGYGPTDSYSGYGPDTESRLDTTDSYSGDTELPLTTDARETEDAEMAVTPRGCSVSGSGCTPPSTHHPVDTEGLIDDEDYSVTEPTNHNAASGSGEMEITLEPGTELGSGTGQTSRRRRRVHRHHNKVGAGSNRPHPGRSEQTDFQDMVREIVEKKREFAMKFGSAKMAALNTRKERITSPARLKSMEKPIGVAEHHDTKKHHHDNVMQAPLEDPALIRLHKLETANYATSEYLHRE